MMRFLALLWNPADARAWGHASLLHRRAISATTLQPVLRDKGLVVYAQGQPAAPWRAHLLQPDRGVIIGAVFERRAEQDEPGAHRPAEFSSAAADALLATQGRSLITDYWGHYVAFLRPDPQQTLVVNEPTGQLPCLLAQTRGVSVLFASLSDYLALRLPLSVHPKYLGSRLLPGALGQRPSPFHEIERVLGGECLQFQLAHHEQFLARRFYWTPRTYRNARQPIEEFGRASRALRHTVLSSTWTWTQHHGEILSRLSGGLDSSILLACLAQAPHSPRITAYTYFQPGGRNDERRWARLAASAARCQHIEMPLDPSAIDLRLLLQLPPAIEPLAGLPCVRRQLETQLVAQHGGSAVVSGEGGDSGFGAHAIRMALIGYLHRHPPNGHAWRLSRQIALHTHQSAWRVLIRSLCDRVFARPHHHALSQQLMSSQLVSAEVRHALLRERRQAHPWFGRRERACAGQRVQLGALMHPPPFDSWGEQLAAPCLLTPLYSQPTIEVLLRIPLDVHFHEGRERGLARAAFATEVPTAILQRLWKDRAPGFAEQLIAANLPFLRECLLDGVLVREGWLDRAALERALTQQMLKSNVYPAEILKHLDTELWTQWWVPNPATARDDTPRV